MSGDNLLTTGCVTIRQEMNPSGNLLLYQSQLLLYNNKAREASHNVTTHKESQ